MDYEKYQYQKPIDSYEYHHENVSPKPVLSMILIIISMSFLNAIYNCYSSNETDTNTNTNTYNQLLLQKMSEEITQFNNILYKENDGCVICLDNFKTDEKIIKLPCNHIYHPECIQDWLKNNITCPLCRNELSII